MAGRKVKSSRVGAAALCVAVCVFCVAPSLALAEEGPGEPTPAAEGAGEPPAEKASAQSAPPDVVILRDGSFVRGTISELVAGQHVVIVPVVGEPRQFSMSEVTYAGPAAGAPPPSTSAPAPAATAPEPALTTAAPSTSTVTIDVTAPDKVTSLHVWGYMNPDGSPGATPYSEKDSLCIAPCTLKLPAGEYRFALSGERGHIKRIANPFYIKEDTTLEAKYVDRRRTRIAGWVILGVSALAGSVLIVMGGADGNRELQLGGGAVGGAGVLVGLIMGVQMDSAKLSVAGENAE